MSDVIGPPPESPVSAATEGHDVAMEQLVGNLLRFGVLLAALVAFIGATIYLPSHAFAPTAYHTFHPDAGPLSRVHLILAEALGFHARAVIQLGILLLIATPIARVAFSLLGFARERDWLYVGVTSLVLVFLLFGLLFSR